MQVIPQNDGAMMELDPQEIGHLNNALNEVCNGFSVANFEAAIGIRQEEARKLLCRIHELHSSEPLNLNLSEIDALRHSLTAVLIGLEPWEYPVRMGFEVVETQKLRARLDALASAIRNGSLRQSA